MTNTNNLIELNGSNFYESVKKGLVLVDFWAAWCGPCRMQTPILEETAKTIGNQITIGKLNVDDYPNLAGDFHVRSIPTLILFQDGVPVSQFVGVQSQNHLVKTINSFIK